MKPKTQNCFVRLALALAIAICNLQLSTAAAPTVTAVAAGLHHTLVLESDGSLWAMGNNGAGQLGDGTTTDRHVPTLIVRSNVVAIAAGNYHSLFLTSDGNLWAFGGNANGELGDGTTIDQHSPEQITFKGGVTAISAGGAHSLFVKSSALWGMGWNGNGQLGTGNSVDVHGASELVTTNVYSISAGQGHSLYETTDGSLWGMGLNQEGELGDGTRNTQYSPEEIYTNHSVFTGVYAMSAGFVDSLYLYGSAVFGVSVWGMGYNFEGELGDGTTSERDSPVETVNSGGSAVACGFGVSLLLKSDGSLWQTENSVWTEIVSSNVTAMALAYDGCIFYIRSDGSLWAIGDNYYGQLGDGTTNNPAQFERILPPLQFVVTNLIASAGSNLVFKGINEFGVGTVHVLSSTNVSIPLNQWIPISTNGLGGGSFTLTATNAINPALPQEFYRLELFTVQ